VTNPYRTQREKAAYQAGLAAGRTAAQTANGDPPKLVSRARARRLSAEQIIELRESGVLQESMKAWNRGELLEDEDE
jgi:hypothetical protein